MEFMQRNRGVITVMLTILLVPMLAFGSTLVELARYKSYTNLYGEIGELAALSSLADFNETLYSDYGLLGMTENQGSSVTACVQSNLNTDLGAIQRLAAPGQVTASTDMLYSLANIQVLERQILEAEKIQAPLSLATGILSGGDYDLDSLLKELQKTIQSAIPGSKMISNLSKSASRLADVADSVTESITQMEGWQLAESRYTSAYSDFDSAISDYLDAKDAYEDSEDEEGNYDEELEEAMNAAKSRMESAQSVYLGEIEAFRTETDVFFKAIEKLVKDATKFKSSVADIGIDAANDKTEKDIDKWLEDKKAETAGRTDLSEEDREDLVNGYEETAKDLKLQAKQDNSVMKSAENAVVGIADQLAGFEYTAVMEVVNSNLDDLKVRVEGYESDLGGDFYDEPGEIAGIVDMASLFDTLNILKDTAAESTTESLKEILTQLYNLVRMFGSTFAGYEIGCESVITDAGILPSTPPYAGDRDTFYAGDDIYVTRLLDEMSGMAAKLSYDIRALYPDSHLADASHREYIAELIEAVIHDIEVICGAINRVSEVLSGQFWQIIKAVQEVSDAFDAVVDLADKIPQVVNNFGEVITTVVSSLYEGALIHEYAFQRFTTRMDYKTSSGTFTGSGSGTKFVTAEVEYLANGSMDERENQKSIFHFILIIRLLANTVQILMNETVGELAAATGPFAPLVYLVWIAAETYIDTALLSETNTRIPLVKSDIFLSPEGVAKLVAALPSELAGFTTGKTAAETVDAMEEALSSVMGEVYEDDWFKMNYEDFLWIRLCFVTNKDKLYRIADLVQMNMRQTDESFLMANTYTYLRVELKGDYNTLMPAFIPMEDGQIRLVKYVGY